jgi:hypothetical protein
MAKRKGSSFSKPKRRTKKRPWLAVAAICEKALIEQDRTPSVIRIIDTITVESDAPEMPPGVTKFTLFLMFRGGPAVGMKTIGIVGLSPSGKQLVNHEREIELLGDELSSIVDVLMQVSVSEAGLYWFEIRLDGNLETRVPLRVRYQQRSQ